MTRTSAPLLALLFASAGACAQSAAKPEFEVASIKPSPPYSPGVGFAVACRGGPETSDPSLFICENYSHVNTVLHAYGIEFYQLSARDWMLTTRFDLRATIPENATKQQFQLMLQNLLAGRFKLKVHHETREIQRYELVVAKGGPKFKQAAPAAKEDGAIPPGPLKLDNDGYPVVGSRGMAMTRGKARLHWPDITMERLVATLSGQVRGPVADSTGLAGKYNINLYWWYADAPASAAGGDPAANEPTGPTLQHALQDQLGLRLESKKDRVYFLVVDHMEKVPTEN